MAVNYLNNINLNKNELQNVSIQKLKTDPTGWLGGIIYNTNDNHFKYYNNSGWQNVASENFTNTSIFGLFDGTFNYSSAGESKTIASKYLPSYVDDVLEYDYKDKAEYDSDPNKNKPTKYTVFPTENQESGKIYVSKFSNKTYRWSGSQYTEISESLALGYTITTAFPGNEGLQLKSFFKGSGSLTTDPKSWTYSLTSDGKGIAYYAEKDAAGNTISSTYFNKGESNKNNNQTVYNSAEFHNTATFKNTTSFEKLASIGSEGIQFGGSSGVKITGNGTSLNINKSTIISGDLTVKDTNGKITSKSLSVEGQANLGSLIVSGETELNGKTTIGDNAADTISVIGTASFSELSTFAKGLKVTEGGLTVAAGETKLNDNVTIGGGSTVGNKTFTINSISTFKNTSTFDNTATFNEDAIFKSVYTASEKSTTDGGIQFGKVNVKDETENLQQLEGSYITWDAEHHALRIVGNIYATGQVSAGGIGENGKGGGDILHKWSDYESNPSSHATWSLGADLGVGLRKYMGLPIDFDPDNTPTGFKDLTTRVKTLEDGGSLDKLEIEIPGKTVSKQDLPNGGKKFTLPAYPSKTSELTNDGSNGDKLYSRVSSSEITTGIDANKNVSATYYHGLGTDKVLVSLYQTSNGQLQQVFADIITTSEKVTINFGSGTPSGSKFTIVVVG